MTRLINIENGSVTADQKQYHINLKDNGKISLPRSIPQHLILNAVVNGTSLQQLNEIARPYKQRDHTGNFRILKKGRCCWGRQKDKTEITFATEITEDKEIIKEKTIERFPILGLEYDPKNYEQVSEIVPDVKYFFRDAFGIDTRVRKTKTVGQVSLESFSDQVKYQSLYENVLSEKISLERKLEYFQMFEYLLKDKKTFRCPNCGAPLKFIQLHNGKETNKGRLAICCTDKKRKHEKKKCAYLRPLDLLDYFVFHDWIVEFSRFGDFVKDEWEVSNPNHPNFIAPKILNDYNRLKSLDF